MDLLVLRVHGVLAERLQMLPAAERADIADRCFAHRQVGAVAFAEHRALDVRGLELAARLHRVALVVDQHLRDVEATAGFLAVPRGQPDLVLARRIAEPVEVG